MELHPYLFSLILYRHPQVLGFDFVVGVIVGSDSRDEWIYRGFPGGIATIEDNLGEAVDIAEFWESEIISQVDTEQTLIDKYIQQLNHEIRWLHIYEQFSIKESSAQIVSRRLEAILEGSAYILPDNSLRYRAIREIASANG